MIMSKDFSPQKSKHKTKIRKTTAQTNLEEKGKVEKLLSKLGSFDVKPL